MLAISSCSLHTSHTSFSSLYRITARLKLGAIEKSYRELLRVFLP